MGWTPPSFERQTGATGAHGDECQLSTKGVQDECYDCRGNGLRLCMFHEIECATCNASGWVCATTGEALPLADLVLQLNMKLRAVTRDLDKALAGSPPGAEQQYEKNNRRGAGGSNYTGD